jgi:glutathione S-transferase
MVTIAAMILYIVMGLRVGAARAKYGVDAPAISGNLDFERTFRVQANTLEWLPMSWSPRASASSGSSDASST